MSLDLAAIMARADKATAGPWWYVAMPYTPKIEGMFFGTRPTGDSLIEGRWLKDQQLYGRTDNYYFIEQARTDIPALVAEVERLQRIEAAAKAYSDSDAAIFDARVRDPRADLYLLFSDMAVARGNLFAALRAAGSGE